MRGQAKCQWKIQLLMNDIKQLLTHFDNYTSRHLYWEANRTPDYVAAFDHYITTSQDIDPLLDIKFYYFINFDKLEYSIKQRLS